MYEILTLVCFLGRYLTSILLCKTIDLCFHVWSRWDMPNNTWILTEKLRTLIIQINFTRNGEVLFKTTNFAGYHY
jgi:acid ceramidase